MVNTPNELLLFVNNLNSKSKFPIFFNSMWCTGFAWDWSFQTYCDVSATFYTPVAFFSSRDICNYKQWRKTDPNNAHVHRGVFTAYTCWSVCRRFCFLEQKISSRINCLAQSLRSQWIPHGNHFGCWKRSFHEGNHSVIYSISLCLFEMWFNWFLFFHSEKVNKRLVQGLIREFAAKCREIMIQIP